MSADKAFDEVVKGVLDTDEFWALPEGVVWPAEVVGIHKLATDRIRNELSTRAANVLDYMTTERMAYLYALARKRDTPPAPAEGNAQTRDHGWDNDRVMREVTSDFTKMMERIQARWDKADAADVGAAIKRQLVHILDDVLTSADPRFADPVREQIVSRMSAAGL